MLLCTVSLLLLVCSLLLMASSWVGNAGVWNGGVLAFISDCGEDSSIYVMDVWRHIQMRFSGDTYQQLPLWQGRVLTLAEGVTSPIVFYGAEHDVIDASAPGFFLPSSSNEMSNVWGQAPDGRWAVVMFRDNNYEIYVTDTERQAAYRLTYNECHDHYPRWQP
ncbi:MAG: hypothetical protein U0694_18045 [Anaerolineae bacterium]